MGPFIAVILFAATVALALRGSWWAPAIPAALCGTGALLYLANAGDLAEYENGYEDKFAGIICMVVGGPWLLIALVITLAARAYRRRGDAPTPRDTA